MASDTNITRVGAREPDLSTLFKKQEYQRLVKGDTLPSGEVRFDAKVGFMLPILNKLRKQEQDPSFCDVTIEADDKLFPAHRAILAAHSQFFRNSLARGWKEATEQRLKLDCVSSKTMEAILEYFYTNSVTIHASTAVELLKACDFLLIDSLKKACERFLSDTLSANNCFSLRRLADNFNAEELFERANDFIYRFFVAVTSTAGGEFLSLSYPEMMTVVSDDEIVVEKEEDVYLAVLRWVKHDPEQRKKKLTRMLKLIRSSLLSRSFVQEQIRREPLVRDNAECVSILERFMEPRPCSKQTECVVIARRLDSGYKFFCHCVESGKTLCLPDPPDPLVERMHSRLVTDLHFPRAVGVDGSLYILFGNQLAVCSRSANPDNSLTASLSWTVCPPFRSKMSHATREGPNTLVALQKKVYAFSNSERMRCFDMNHNRWTEIAEMNFPRSSCSLVATDSHIYAIGGDRNGRPQSEVEKYNPSTDTWSMGTPCPSPRSHAGAIYFHEKVYVIGGVGPNRRKITNGCVYDPVADSWSEVSAPSLCLSNWLGCAYMSLLEVNDSLVANCRCVTSYAYNDAGDCWSMLAREDDVFEAGVVYCTWKVRGVCLRNLPMAPAGIFDHISA